MQLRTLPICVEDRFLTRQDASRLWEEIKLDQTERLVVAVEGAPGSGKSTLAKMLQEVIQDDGIEVGLNQTDWGCVPRTEQSQNPNIIDWYRETATKEALIYPGARFSFTAYNNVTRERDMTISVVSPRRGVLIVEGLHAVEFTCQTHNGPTVAIPFDISSELSERRRAQRNLEVGRWRPEEVGPKSRLQRSYLRSFYRDLAQELGRTSVSSQNTIRAYL